MTVILENTTAGAVETGIRAERFAQGSSAVGRVLTLVIVADESSESDAIRCAVRAAREHPCRILAAIPRPGRGKPQLDASITVGGNDGLGEVVELRLRGPLAHHTESVILPLLVPDAPVVAWWPGRAPDVPVLDPVGALAKRRITDASLAARPLAALQTRRTGYTAGDTDLAWTRTTPWRALLAAMLDQPYDPVRSATVHVQRSNPSGPLLASWLQAALGIPVELAVSRGPGVTAVRLHTARGDLSVVRPDGRVAVISRPGMPDREAALPRRSREELVAEELRRLDPDEIFGETLAGLPDIGEAAKQRASKKATATRAAATKAPAARAAAAKKPARKSVRPARKRAT